MANLKPFVILPFFYYTHSFLVESEINASSPLTLDATSPSTPAHLLMTNNFSAHLCDEREELLFGTPSSESRAHKVPMEQAAPLLNTHELQEAAGQC